MLKKIFKFLLADRKSASYPELPEAGESGESNISGLFLIGDVAGAPLVKVGLNAGYKLGNALSKKLAGLDAVSDDEYDVVVAIGKSGNPRKAGVPGESEHPEKVLHILKDPADFAGKNVLVYGGGDVAIEAAVSLADFANVTLAYRGTKLTRPKQRNLALLKEKELDSGIAIKLDTIIRKIDETAVVLENRGTGESETIENDVVFEMLGSEPPTNFFKRIGVKMEFAWNLKRIATLIFSFSLVYTLYAWKKGYWPFHYAGAGLKNLPAVFHNTSFWYSALYTILMLVFGLKAMRRWSDDWRDKHQTYRFASLICFQLVSFILIECVFAVFLPGNTWWRAYAVNNPFPLLFDSFYNISGVSLTDMRWIFVGLGLLMTFVVIPITVRWHGKRFCTWVCGCGGLAETFGDKWRHHSPKGFRSRRWEFMGTLVMFWAFVSAGVILFAYGGDTRAAGAWHSAYAIIADFWLVAVIPVALYPIFGGKIWCRYWCPLAKYMQILSRWYGRLHIESNEHCIQCGKCSKYCQVGVDVMEFAKNQQPFSNKNSSCIHCGICITVCPMNVLKFENKKVEPRR